MKSKGLVGTRGVGTKQENWGSICKVGLTRFHPTSCDKSDKMRDKQKVLNNFPTTLFIKNWLSSKCIWVHLSQLLESIFLINSMLEELFKKFASLGGVQARSAWRFKFRRHGIAPLQTSIQITWRVGDEKKKSTTRNWTEGLPLLTNISKTL